METPGSVRSQAVIRWSGEAGEGVVSIGHIIGRAAARSGLYVFTEEKYGAEVRGGPASVQVRMGHHPVLSPGDGVDLLMAMDKEDISEHRKDLVPDANIVFGAMSNGKAEEGTREWPLPLLELAQKAGAGPQAKNMVALGVSAGLIPLPLPLLEGLASQFFGKKQQALESNLAALRQGYAYAHEMPIRLLPPTSGPRPELILMSGNEAVALGALAGGCEFFSGYPITPASEIMHFLARELPRAGGTLLQAEDEMAALGLAIGASYAGRRAMTSTSGPGLSLMVELINLASMAEVPVVIVDVQRAGPSTGMPTKTEQGDLNLALFGSHGESPRIILAPTDVESCFHLTARAFSLAQRYQMPVLVLSDQALGTCRQSFPKPTIQLQPVRSPQPDDLDGYRRYRITESGISPRALPGQEEGFYVSTGLEHNEKGFPDYSPQNHRLMAAKRFQKLATAGRELNEVHRFGPSGADFGIVGWGSTEGAVREAVAAAEAEGLRVAGLYPLALNPLPMAKISEFARSVRKIIVPEVNFTGQLARLLRGEGLLVETMSLPEAARPGVILRAIRETLRHENAIAA